MMGRNDDITIENEDLVMSTKYPPSIYFGGTFFFKFSSTTHLLKYNLIFLFALIYLSQ